MDGSDQEHLDLLATFHFVLAGITALFSCFPFLHVFMGLAMVFLGGASNDGPPVFFGLIFVVMGLTVVLLGWCLAVCMFICGKNLKRRKNWMFCMVVAGVECVFMPLGTILGVFTIITLQKESVKALFEGETVAEDA